jgi:hypothetical protein
MSKPIVLTPTQWWKLKGRLDNDYGRTTMMISWKTKRVLGFTVREHSGYRPRTVRELDDYDRSDNIWHDTERERKFHRENTHEHVICLDFYNEPKRTMFLLKYSEYLYNSDKIMVDN